MTDPIKKLAEIYPTLENGHKAAAREVKASIEEMQARILDLESTLSRQPLPEAPASMTAKVVHAATQIEWLVTVREAAAARLLISAMPIINEALADQGLIAFDAYVDGRRTDRSAGGPNGPNQQGDPTGRIRVGTQLRAESAGESSLPTPGPTHQAIQGSDYSFRAKSLIRTMDGDKVYYKVKETDGGQFAKFGVTIWPEALQAAGFDLDTLTGETSLAGYTAYYVLKDNGKPAKVIGLQHP